MRPRPNALLGVLPRITARSIFFQGYGLSGNNLTDDRIPMRYAPTMPVVKKRPVILSLPRKSPHSKAIAKAVRELADLRKNDPRAYKALMKKSAGRTVNIVPG